MSKDPNMQSTYESLKKKINIENEDLKDYRQSNQSLYQPSNFIQTQGNTASQQYFPQQQYYMTPSNNMMYYPYVYPNQFTYSGYSMSDFQNQKASSSSISFKKKPREGKIKKKSVRLEKHTIDNKSSDSEESEHEYIQEKPSKTVVHKKSEDSKSRMKSPHISERSNKYTLSIKKCEESPIYKKPTNTQFTKKISEEAEIFLSKCRLNYLVVQKGSKKLQNRLDNIESEREITLIYEKMQEIGLYEVSSSQYGNYFLQKLITRLTFKEVMYFWNYAIRNKYEFWLHEYANRIMISLIMKLLEFKKEKEIQEVVTPMIETLAFNKYGCFTLVMLLENQFISDKAQISNFIKENFYSLSFHAAGTILVKKYMIYLLNSDQTKKRIMSFTEKHICNHIQMLSTVKNSHYLVLWSIKEKISNVVDCFRKNIDSIESNEFSKDIIAELDINSTREN